MNCTYRKREYRIIIPGVVYTIYDLPNLKGYAIEIYENDTGQYDHVTGPRVFIDQKKVIYIAFDVTEPRIKLFYQYQGSIKQEHKQYKDRTEVLLGQAQFFEKLFKGEIDVTNLEHSISPIWFFDR